MKTLVLVFCVTVLALTLVSCSSSTDTQNPPDARTTLPGLWDVNFSTEIIPNGTYTMIVSGDSVIMGTDVYTGTFNGSNVKYSRTKNSYSTSFDISVSDANNFSGNFAYNGTGVPEVKGTIKGVRKK